MRKFPKLVQSGKRGQFVIPKDIRHDLKINEGTGFWVYAIGDEGILLKKIDPQELSEHPELLDKLSEKADKLGISKKKLKDAEEAYKKTRQGRLELV